MKILIIGTDLSVCLYVFISTVCNHVRNNYIVFIVSLSERSMINYYASNVQHAMYSLLRCMPEDSPNDAFSVLLQICHVGLNDEIIHGLQQVVGCQ
jgi:hypothetical protein